MDVSSTEATDISSPKTVAASKEPSVKTGSPDVYALSPLTKSRYGRTRKPKISEDFYNIDVIFESARESKRSPRNTQVVKNVKPRQQSPSKPKDSPTALKSPKASSKSPIVHVTGDDGVSELKLFTNESNSKAIHNFFNEESGMSLLQSAAEAKTDSRVTEAKQKDIAVKADDSLNLQSVDVTKVLKIIATKSPDQLQGNSDSKANFKPVLKTYSNKRKNFNKVGIVESFGLPDKPIFPLENDTPALNEPKRIKNLDVAAPSSENDVNLVDKKLLDTPWKIASSLNADNAESETLLDCASDDFKNVYNDVNTKNFLLSPVKENLAANKKSPSIVDIKSQIARKLSLNSPKKLKFDKSPVLKQSSKADETKSAKIKSPVQPKIISREIPHAQEPPKDTKNSEELENRSPRKRKEEDLSTAPPENDDVLATKQKISTQREATKDASSPRKQKPLVHVPLFEDARSPKKRKQISEKSFAAEAENCDTSPPAIKQKKLAPKEDSERAKSPRKQPPGLNRTPAKDTKSPKKQPEVTLHTKKSPKKQKQENAVSPKKQMPENAKSPKKQLQKNAASPKRQMQETVGSPKKQIRENVASPKKQMQMIRSRTSDSLKSPVRQKSDLEVTKNTRPISKPGRDKSVEPAKISKNKHEKTDINEAKLVKKPPETVSPKKQAKSVQPPPEKSPTIAQKLKRSHSPKKPVVEKTDANEESASPAGQKNRAHLKRHTAVVPDVSENNLDLQPVQSANNNKNDNKAKPQKDAASPVKRSSRLAKSEDCSKDIKVELIDLSEVIVADDITVELDEMSLEHRVKLQSHVLSPRVEVTKTLRRSNRSLPSKLAEVGSPLVVEITEEVEENEYDAPKTTKRTRHSMVSLVAEKTAGTELKAVEKVELEEEVDVKDEPDDIEVGDLMWAKLRGFPYWPCLITKEPDTLEYKKISFSWKNSRMMYHVRFFGDRGRRSWVPGSSLMRFTSKNDLMRLFNEIKNQSPTSAVLQSYTVKAYMRAKWENATAEAESLQSSTVQERFDFFFNMFASEKEKKQKLKESMATEANLPSPKNAKTHVSRSKLKAEDAHKIRSQNLPTLAANEVRDNSRTRKSGKSDKPAVEGPDNSLKAKRLDKSDLEKQPLSEVNLKSSLAMQKRALKIKERQESRDGSLDESFFKGPWQGFHVPKKGLGLNEASSEYSLSDTDSLSKSSSSTPIPSSFKAQIMRQKRNNLFRGVPKDRVCQVCKNPGEIVKCKGPCSGIFHYKCAADKYSNESTIVIKEEPFEPSTENEDDGADETMDSKDLNGHMVNGIPDTTNEDDMDPENNETDNLGSLNGVLSSNNDRSVDKSTDDTNTKEKASTDNTADASNTNNKVEIIYIDCDDSDFEHTLTPKVRLTPSADFRALSLAEQIDIKMKEVMQKLEKSTRYADSTTDYTSSEESSSNLLPPAEKPKVVQKKKSLKVKHVTGDHISFASSASSEDLVCESTQEVNGMSNAGISSTKNVAELNMEKNEAKNDANEAEKPVTGDVTPQSEGSNESNFNKDDCKGFKCGYCISEVEPPCFVCHKEVSSKNESFRQKCSIYMCGKCYHPECLKMWPQTQWSLISTAKHKNSNKELDTFVCPVHVCHTCASDNPHAAVSRSPSDKVVKCLHCPATYHTTNYCVPAGTLILSTSQIVCPRHLGRESGRKGKTAKYARTINTPWCFICSKGGDLICCETCPTSVHRECLPINLLDDGTFICEDCETGRFPLYDEIVWVKLGTYRWWPAVILFPNEIPGNIRNIPHSKGEFVVKFFGTHDHYWVSRGRVFLFQEGDRGHCSPTKKRVDALFKKSIEEAAAAHNTKKIFKSSKEAEIKTGMKPPPYIRIKVNKPVGNVRLFDGNISNTTACECDPAHEFPCGPDSYCLNRLLLTECDPNICPARDKCYNQRFEKREYPPLVPYRTQARGWGLKSHAPIRKGSFVIEYVGEIIDEQEYQRRIRKMHEQKDENYYFLTIDKDRIIDAGPKGNLARFMNHCCQPNCETQKWTVNGDTRVGLFALEDIRADAELTFNYNLECIGKEQKICKCGAPNCKGFIGNKSKQDESQKKPKNHIKKKKRPITPPVSKNLGPCFICGQSGGVATCHNKLCNKFYHLHCVNLEFWPEGKWACPWHNCNVCTKRTIRCCVKCTNSYCPVHSEGNVRYDKLLGFICFQHDPNKESHELSNRNLTVKNSKNSTTVLTTEETDVTSTTSDEIDQNAVQLTKDVHNDLQAIDLIAAESVTSTPIKKKDIVNFAYTLQEFESDLILERLEIPKLIPGEQTEKSQNLVAGKRKRGRPKQSIGNTPKKLKLSDQVNEVAVKPKPSFAAPSLLDIPAQNEVKLSASVPTRHLRTTRNNAPQNIENKRFLKQQSELEKDLPIRKRSRLRCEATL